MSTQATNNPTTGRPPRPSRRTEAVLARAATLLMDAIIESYPKGFKDLDATRRAEYEEDLRGALEVNRDGFQLGMDLDRGGWQVDAAMVEILDYDWVDDAHRRAVKEWVRFYRIEPARKEGDAVAVALDEHEAAPQPAGTYHGTIVRIYRDEANYSVAFPALGHHAWDNGAGTVALIFPFERVEERNT